MFDAIGGRKFVYAILVVVLGFVLVFIGKVTAEDWMNFASIVGGIYVIGNIVSQFSPPTEPPNTG
jgi:hypothetical protein